MNVPVSKEELATLTYIGSFNDVHGTNLTWTKYFEEIGMTCEQARDDRVLEYESYLRWVALRNSPLMKALK